MSNRSWLKQEIPRWVKEDVISEDAGKKILSRYKRQDSAAYREALFILAAVCIIGGIFFLCASLWSGLDQDQRFLLALAPLAVSFLLMAVVVLVDRGAFGGFEKKKEPLPEEKEDGEEALPLRKKTSGPVHRFPVFLREAAASLHGICLIGAFWMVGDSFKLSSDLYSALAFTAFLLLIMTVVTESAGMGIIYMIVSVGIFYSAPVGDGRRRRPGFTCSWLWGFWVICSEAIGTGRWCAFPGCGR